MTGEKETCILNIMKKYWLMKTEPGEYSIDDLVRDSVTVWTGVRNYQVRNMLRDEVAVGDSVLVYHSSTKIPGVVGEAFVSKAAFPDPLQFVKKSNYFDEKSTVENPRWLSVEVTFVQKLPALISLEEILVKKTFINSPLIRKGNRLSIIPLTKDQFTNLI